MCLNCFAACAAQIEGKRAPLAESALHLYNVCSVLIKMAASAVQAQGTGAALPLAAAPAGAGSGRAPLAGAV